jgi:SET domain-containing protein
MLITTINVTDSVIHGKGLFASRIINPGEVIYELRGIIIDHKYSKDFSANYPNWVGIGWEKWIIPDSINPMNIQNHSCLPNAIVDDELNVVCIKRIEANNEILIDYSTTELDPFWSFLCSCKQICCRKLIKSYQFLPESLKECYREYLGYDFTKYKDTVFE